jgi:hypothetical protein
MALELNKAILAIEWLARRELGLPAGIEFSTDELNKLKPLLMRICNEHPEFGWCMKQIDEENYEIYKLSQKKFDSNVRKFGPPEGST